MNACFRHPIVLNGQPADAASDLAGALPAAFNWAQELPALLDEISPQLPNRDDIIAAIEDACGEDLSCTCVARIADAVVELYRPKL